MSDFEESENKQQAATLSGRRKIKINFVLNVIYQIFGLLILLITSPYLSRVLGTNAIGVYSFSSSIVTYFSLFGAFGFNMYGQREIAKHQGDKHSQSVIFWNIVIGRLITVGFAEGLFLLLFFLGVFGSYSYISILLSINVLSVLLDVTFLFQGNEDFLHLVLRNALVKILVLCLVFFLVKSSDDLWKYVLLVAGSSLLSFLAMLILVPKAIVRVSRKEIHIWPQFAGAFRCFIPTLATSLYAYVDKLMLGFLVPGTYETTSTIIANGASTVVNVTRKISDLENGYYYQADKIINLCATILTSLGVVMESRNANELAKKNSEVAKENLYKAMKLIWLIACPMMAGLIAISDNFVFWFFGSGYEKVGILLKVLSPMIVLSGFASLAGMHYLIPAGKENSYSAATFIAVIADVVLNFLFIPLYSLYSVGAAIASVLSAVLMASYLGFKIRKFVSIKRLLTSSWNYILASFLMAVVVYGLTKILPNSLANLILVISIGFVFYFFVLFLLGGESFFSLFSRKKDPKKENKKDLVRSQGSKSFSLWAGRRLTCFFLLSFTALFVSVTFSSIGIASPEEATAIYVSDCVSVTSEKKGTYQISTDKTGSFSSDSINEQISNQVSSICEPILYGSKSVNINQSKSYFSFRPKNTLLFINSKQTDIAVDSFISMNPYSSGNNIFGSYFNLTSLTANSFYVYSFSSKYCCISQTLGKQLIAAFPNDYSSYDDLLGKSFDVEVVDSAASTKKIAFLVGCVFDDQSDNGLFLRKNHGDNLVLAYSDVLKSFGGTTFNVQTAGSIRDNTRLIKLFSSFGDRAQETFAYNPQSAVVDKNFDFLAYRESFSRNQLPVFKILSWTIEISNAISWAVFCWFYVRGWFSGLANFQYSHMVKRHLTLAIGFLDAFLFLLGGSLCRLVSGRWSIFSILWDIRYSSSAAFCASCFALGLIPWLFFSVKNSVFNEDVTSKVFIRRIHI